MKKMILLIIVVFLIAGCSSQNETPVSSGNNTTVAEDLQDVANDLKETGEEIKDTFSETFSDLLGSSSKEDDSSTNTDEQAEPEETAQPEQQEEIEYIQATVDEMYEILHDNALKAKKTYEDQYVEVTGVLGTIDSNGDYICLNEMNTAYSFYSVECFIKNDEQLNYVLEMSSGKKYTIRVKITLVGEVLGYAGDIIEFVD
ncbi:MAG: hypothetical protein IKI61_07530 [Erysipelotrichaceae bacterium]|nr:hypothetical protein [Erysipelotrichaceae bacterium]